MRVGDATQRSIQTKEMRRLHLLGRNICRARQPDRHKSGLGHVRGRARGRLRQNTKLYVRAHGRRTWFPSRIHGGHARRQSSKNRWSRALLGAKTGRLQPEYTPMMAFAVYEIDCSAMDPTNDPNCRPRIGAEAQRDRDAEVARLRRDGVPFRRIAERLDMCLARCRSRCGGRRSSQTPWRVEGRATWSQRSLTTS